MRPSSPISSPIKNVSAISQGFRSSPRCPRWLGSILISMAAMSFVRDWNPSIYPGSFRNWARFRSNRTSPPNPWNIPFRGVMQKTPISVLKNDYCRRQLESWQTIRQPQLWDRYVLSMENRLAKFLSSQTVQMFMGLKHGNIAPLKIMDEGATVLICLGASPFLDPKSANVFASLFFYTYFWAAMVRAERAFRIGVTPLRHLLICD